MSDRAAAIKRNASGAHEFFIHPRQLEDVEHDRDTTRKQLLMSRLKQYEMLESPPIETKEYFERKGWGCKNDHDLIDNLLLLCVERPAVDFLVTNDAGILKKARRAGLDSRVMNLDAFVELTRRDDSSPVMVLVKDEPCHVVDYHLHFFDSLRSSYPSFDSWFEGISRKHRRCWTIRKDGELLAICVYKSEPDGFVTDDGVRIDSPTLKLCTFKVDESVRGAKLGEKLLSEVFQYCRSHEDICYVYATVRSLEQPHLVDLFEMFGFSRVGIYKEDDVYGKYVRPNGEADLALPKDEFARKLFPSLKTDEAVSKFLVPIEPRWHEKLFPELSDFAYTLFADYPEMYTSESNTIRKAYLCNSNNKSLQAGDLLLFYRSHDKQHVDAVGVVSSWTRTGDLEMIRDQTKSRTVYSHEEISELLRGGREVLVVLFDYVCGIDKPVTLQALRAVGITSFQSITHIGHQQFMSLFGGIL